jgi:peptide/nickel transport system substrate-binding protein
MLASRLQVPFEPFSTHYFWGGAVLLARWCVVGAVLVALTACTKLQHKPDIVDGAPVRGGTLKIVGFSDVDHLSSSGAYSTASLGLLWAFARQLVTYPLSEDFETASKVAPDLAQTLPTVENGGISADGRVYTFHIRRGVNWNTNPPREVNAHDVVRGMKLLCNPVVPAGAPGYYTSTILGMNDYCDAFAKVPGTVDDIREFIESRSIEGVQATNDFTVIFRLVQPASDFLNILGMPFASPVPVEYLNYVPDSPQFRQNTISNGPYQIVKYTANREIVLERNPAWNAQSDPIRPANVDRIQISLGIDQRLAQLQLAAGTADLNFELAPPTSETASLLEIGDPNLLLSPPGEIYTGMWYLAINMVGSNNDGALKNPDVREALQYAADKAAVIQIQGRRSHRLREWRRYVRHANGQGRSREGAEPARPRGLHRPTLAQAGLSADGHLRAYRANSAGELSTRRNRPGTDVLRVR